MKSAKVVPGMLLCLAILVPGSGRGQQYNSDSYISKQHGTATVILTFGQRNTMFMTTFSLIPGWEFTAAAYLYNKDSDIWTADGYSTSLYAKYMFFENAEKTGGFAMKLGTGIFPGYLDATQSVTSAFQTFWTNAPLTLPLFGNTLSWDIMPGASVTRNYGPEDHTAWAFTYSTRLAWYPVSPTWSVCGEVYGASGEAGSKPNYRIGLRLEPDQHSVFAFTYDDEVGGAYGAGWEVGMMLFSPPFFCLGGCE